MAGGFLRNPLILFLAALLGAHGSLACGAETKAPAPGAKPAAASAQWNELDRAVGREEYAKAKKLADGILQRGSADDREKALAVYGRILLGLGEKEPARQYLAMLAKRETSGVAKDTAKIYAAWLQALDGKSDEAIKVLEQIAKSKSPTRTTAEAADVLAMLHMARGERQEARKAVDAGIQSLKYINVKDGYVHALLRGRLNSNLYAGEAEKLYDAAEKLRKQGKFAEAGKGFFEVRSKYPESEWAHPAGFHIGQCLIGIGRPTDAANQWEKFIQEAPAGPWRGQAHVAMVDLMLQSRADLAQAAAHAMAATATLDRPLDKDAEASWQQAAYDIRVRQGIVSLAEGRFDAAIQAFQQAKKNDAKGETKTAGPSTEALAGLDRLIEAARDREKLIPEELSVGDDRAAMMLRVGVLYHVLRQADRAEIYFNLSLGGPTRSSSAAHRSFAHYGLSLVRESTAAGKAACEASLKEYPQASFHDETLYRLATVIEDIADKESAAPPPASTAKSKQDMEALAKAEGQRRAGLIKAKGQALSCWLELAKKHPASRRAPEALLRAGILGTEVEKPQEALAAFEQLVQKHPDSPWTGEAHVRLIDVKLEHLFDLSAAKQHAAEAIAWYEKLDPSNAGRTGVAHHALWAAVPKEPSESADDPSNSSSSRPRTLRQVGYDIYVRAGLIEYLQERAEQSLAFFEKAKPLQPERTFVVVQGHIPTGIERLLEVAKSGKFLTPKIVRQGDESAKLILMLADVYHEGREHLKSLSLCSRVVDGQAKATHEQKSYAYFRRGWACYRLEAEGFSPDAAFDDYAAAVRTAPKAPWADNAMFKAANIQWNHKKDADAAVRLWQRLCQTYPDSEEAIRSAYYVGVVYEWTDRPDDAIKAFRKLLAQWPDSPFTEVTRKHLANLEAADSGPKHRNSRK